MAKTAQILLLLLVAAAVQSYSGRRLYRGRSHGRFRNPYDYNHHRRHGDVERPRDHYQNRHHQKNLYNPGDQGADNPPLSRQPAEYDGPGVESPTTVPALVDPVPVSNPSPGTEENLNGDGSASNPGEDSTGVVNDDKPDDVANVIDNGKSPGDEEPDHIGDNINGDESSSGDNFDDTTNLDGLSPGGDDAEPNNGGNLDGNISGNLPDVNLDKPTGNIIVNGLEPGQNDDSSSIDNHVQPDEGNSNNEIIDGKLPNGKKRPGHDDDDDYLNNNGMLPENKPGPDDNNIDNNKLLPNGIHGSINVNGLSPGDDNKHHDGGDSINVNGLSPNGHDNNSGHGSINVDGLSPGGDNNKPHDNDININGLSPGGDDAIGNNEHGGLPSDDLGKPNNNNNINTHGQEPEHNSHHDHATQKPDINNNINNDGLPSGGGSIGTNINLPDITGHVFPDTSGHITDHGGLEPQPKPDQSGNIDPHFIHPLQNPDVEGHLGIDQPQTDPTFPGNDILPNPGDHMIPRPMPDVNGRPDDIIPSIEIPNQVDNKDDGKRNNSMMIPVLLPGGGHIMVNPGSLGNIPSYIIVMINGQPTLIQNPGLGIGGGNGGGSIDLSKLILGNNGGIHSGTVLPSWLNLGGIGGIGGNGGGISVLPNIQQPIWIGSQMPNFGGGSGPIIIPTPEPVQPVPVPIPVPRPLPPPRPIYPTPQPIPMPGPINPGFGIAYPPQGYPWPSIWNPSNPNVNVNFTHMPLMPNQGSNIDWKSLLALLANIDSRLPQPHPPQQTKQPLPNQPGYPSYPYPQYPYPYPLPYPYPPYFYPPNYPFPKNNPSGKDTANPEPRPDVPVEPKPVPRPDVPVEPKPVPRPDVPVEPKPVPRPDVPVEPKPVPRPDVPIIPGPEPRPDLPIETHPEVPLEPKPQPRPDVPLEPRPDTRPEGPIIPGPEPEPHTDVPIGPRPDVPLEPRPQPLPDVPLQPTPEPRPEVPLKPSPEPQLEVPVEPKPKPRPDVPVEPTPEPLPNVPLEPIPQPRPDVPLEPIPQPRPDVPIVPGPEPSSNVPLEPTPEPQPQTRPDPSLKPKKDTPSDSRPDVPEETRPDEPLEPRPEPRPDIPLEPRPDVPIEPRPDIPREPHPDVPLKPQPDEPLTPRPEPRPEVPLEHRPDVPLEPRPEPRPVPHPEHPEHRPRPDHNRVDINMPDIHITLPKPTHIGKPKPGYPGLDSDLIDILNVLLKYPDRNSHQPKNLGPLIKLLLNILKPGDKNQHLIPNLNEGDKGKLDLGNLGHLLLHLLDHKEPNLNVLVEPGMDEGTRANLILLLNLLANNLEGSYPGMGYYQPENPLLYFLGHFPCDHPNIQAISGLQSNSNLWQLLANMYGHNYSQELRLERSAEDTDDKPFKAETKTN